MDRFREVYVHMKNNQGERIVIGIERKVSEERSTAMMYKKASHIKNVGK